MALVRALLLDPEVLLLDEFSANLDDLSREAAEGALQTFRAADPKRASILVSHDARQRERLLDAVVELDERGQMPKGTEATCTLRT